jgi:hypothetical protein
MAREAFALAGDEVEVLGKGKLVTRSHQRKFAHQNNFAQNKVNNFSLFGL